MKFVTKGGKRFAARGGKLIEVETVNPINPDLPLKRRRKGFAAQWVKLPRHWITGLRRTRSVHTYELALTILMVAYERQTDTVTLSGAATQGMSRETKRRAARELEEFGLIQIKGFENGGRVGHPALKITIPDWNNLSHR